MGCRLAFGWSLKVGESRRVFERASNETVAPDDRQACLGLLTRSTRIELYVDRHEDIDCNGWIWWLSDLD